MFILKANKQSVGRQQGLENTLFLNKLPLNFSIRQWFAPKPIFTVMIAEGRFSWPIISCTFVLHRSAVEKSPLSSLIYFLVCFLIDFFMDTELPITVGGLWPITIIFFRCPSCPRFGQWAHLQAGSCSLWHSAFSCFEYFLTFWPRLSPGTSRVPNEPLLGDPDGRVFIATGVFWVTRVGIVSHVFVHLYIYR